MSSLNTISVDKLARLIGTARVPAPSSTCAPTRTSPPTRALIPGSRPRAHARRRRLGARVRAAARPSSSASTGAKLSQGVAAWLRHAGVDAERLEGGFEAWRGAELPLVRGDKLPPATPRAAPSG